MDAQRALLDSLFGKDRNAGADDASKRQSFKDDDVCKYYLVGDCPHDMFVNQEGKTAVNSPIGPCKKQHSEAMKVRLKSDPQYEKFRMRYLCDLQAMLQRLVDENDRKARSVRQKLKAGVSCTNETSEAVSGHISAREMLVSEKMEAAEKMAEEGNMEASQDTMREAEKLAHEKYRLSRLREVAGAWVDDLCDVCGSQISWRAIEELEARDRGRPHPHTMGAWHRGWARVREALESVKKATSRDVCEEERTDGGGDAASKRGGRDRSRSRSKDRAKDRAWSRDRNRGRSGRHHGRETSRGGRGERERDAERNSDRVRVKDGSRVSDEGKAGHSPPRREQRGRSQKWKKDREGEREEERERHTGGQKQLISKRNGDGRKKTVNKKIDRVNKVKGTGAQKRSRRSSSSGSGQSSTKSGKSSTSSAGASSSSGGRSRASRSRKKSDAKSSSTSDS